MACPCTCLMMTLGHIEGLSKQFKNIQGENNNLDTTLSIQFGAS